MNNKRRPIPERFWTKVAIVGDGCWEWQAGTNRHGYGTFYVGRGKHTDNAHRVAYQLAFGPIPDGLDIDHLCRNRLCVRPSHLEAVTHRVNVQRGAAGATTRARLLALTECKYGHPFDKTNTAYKKSTGQRLCRTCNRERCRAQRQSRMEQP